MNLEAVDREITRQGLYAAFNLKNEDYITSVKLFYIYDFIQPVAGENSIILLRIMKKQLKHRSNEGRINELYQMVKQISLVNCNRYEICATPPVNSGYYLPGHRL